MASAAMRWPPRPACRCTRAYIGLRLACSAREAVRVFSDGDLGRRHCLCVCGFWICGLGLFRTPPGSPALSANVPRRRPSRRLLLDFAERAGEPEGFMSCASTAGCLVGIAQLTSLSSSNAEHPRIPSDSDVCSQPAQPSCRGSLWSEIKEEAAAWPLPGDIRSRGYPGAAASPRMHHRNSVVPIPLTSMARPSGSIALSLMGADPDHSIDEERWLTFGRSANVRLLVVSHTDWGDAVRIISARPCTAAERKLYEEG